MPVLLKRLLLWPILLLFLIVLIFAALLFFIDPNDFKGDIEKQAKDNAGINLSIQGDISWSLMPLGLDIQQLSIQDQRNQDFAAFQRLLAQVDLMSILGMTPKVNTLLLEGLSLDLKRDKNGKANWENLLPESTKDESTNPKAEKPTNEETKANTDISFLVEKVRLNNANIGFVDQMTEQDIKISNVYLSMDDIALDQAFPVSLKLDLVNANPVASITQDLNLSLKISKDFSQIDISALNALVDIKELDFIETPNQAKLSGNIAIDTKQETIAANAIEVSIAGLASKADVTLSNYGTEASILGKVQVLPFDIKEALKLAKLPALKTQDPQALSKLSLSTDISNPGGIFTFDNVKINVDDSNWEGTLSANPISQAVRVNLTGDSINVDKYLPPSTEAQNTADTEAPPKEAGNENAELLPVDLIKTLDLDLKFLQKALVVKDIKVDNVDIRVTAKDGLINVSKANAQVFEGTVENTASIDARESSVAWKATNKVGNLQPLKELETINLWGFQLGGSGIFNTTTEVSASGNSIASLRKTILGNVEAEVVDGSITGINLNREACKGFAQLNSKRITKQDWPLETKFNTLQLEVGIDGPKVQSNKLLVENIGLKASGKGGANIDAQTLKYELAISPLGELGDEACAVNEKIKGLAIPIVCEGKFTDDPASLCDLNYKKMGRLVEKFAKKEAKRKLDKEIDRAIDNKAKKYLGEEGSKAVGDLLKKLF